MSPHAPGMSPDDPARGAAMASTGRGRAWIRSLAHHNESGLVAILVLVTLVAAIAVPAFRSSGNPTQILDNSSLVVIVALGEALVILARQIDLSVAAILGLAAYLIGSVVGHVGFAGPVVGIVLALALGAVLGLFNGVLIERVRMPAIIATLATLSIYGGLQVDRHPRFSAVPIAAAQLARQHRLYLVDRPQPAGVDRGRVHDDRRASGPVHIVGKGHLCHGLQPRGSSVPRGPHGPAHV